MDYIITKMNKINFKAIILLIYGILMAACEVYYDDLGNHYAKLENREIVRITKESEDALSYDEIIRPQVLNYAYDDKYIIAYQIYDGSEYYDVSPSQDKKEADSLLSQFSKLKKLKHCFWIINKKTDKVYGPMTQSEFDRQCKIMRVEATMRKFQEEKFVK